MAIARRAEAGFNLGTLFHAWLQQIAWLDDGLKLAAPSLAGMALPLHEARLRILLAKGTTREALQRALPRLVDEPLARLRAAAPLRAEFFDALLAPDAPRNLLLWLDNPAAFRQRSDSGTWAAFVTQAQINEWILADLEKVDRRARRFQR